MEDTNQTNPKPTVAAGSTDTPVAPAGAAGESAATAATETTTPIAATVLTASDLRPAATEGTAIDPTTAPTVNHRTALVKQYAIALGIVVVIGAGLTYALEQQGRIQTHLFDKVTALVMPIPSAAVVNGVKISMTDYDKNKLQLEQAATESGADLTDAAVQEQIKTQALDVLVNTELLRQEATKAGITVTQEQIDARYAEIVKGLQGEDKLLARMTELGITKEGLLKDIAAEILIQTHLAAAVDTSSITIDPKDIKATYDQANTNPDSPLPPLAQVSTAIESKLRQDKEQEMINAYIQKARDAATIETKI